VCGGGGKHEVEVNSGMCVWSALCHGVVANEEAHGRGMVEVLAFMVA